MKVEDIEAVIPDNFVWEEHVKEVRKKGFVILEGVHKRKDGTTFPVEVNVRYVTHNERDYMVAVARDINERRKTEEKLRTSEERLSRISEASFEGIAFTEKGKIIDANKQLADMLGYTLPELIGKEVKELIPPEYRDIVLHNIMKGFEGTYESSVFKKDGSIINIESRARHTLYKGSRLRVTAIRDITERKKAEEEKEKLEAQLLHSQKLDAVGKLAGGVAHDFNNILTAILGYGNLIQMKMKEDDPLRIYIDQILASTNRGATLTQSLLTLSRKQIITTKPVNLNKLVTRIEELLLRVIGEDIKLKTVLTDEDATIMVDSGQIEQVLMNLATNARDAMPDGGLLIIETGLVEIDDEFIETHAYGTWKVCPNISNRFRCGHG
jgi:PAS domain S-box-containing protein